MTPHKTVLEPITKDLAGDLDQLNRWQSARPTEATDERDQPAKRRR